MLLFETKLILNTSRGRQILATSDSTFPNPRRIKQQVIRVNGTQWKSIFVSVPAKDLEPCKIDQQAVVYLCKTGEQ